LRSGADFEKHRHGVGSGTAASLTRGRL
jgi:hypothetical protein